MIRVPFLVACAIAFIPLPSPAAGPELDSVERIWDRAPHNAFTDLIRWHDRWYCTFREAEAHVGGDGRICVLESADGRRWEPVALIAEEGIDLRDPKLPMSTIPDDGTRARWTRSRAAVNYGGKAQVATKSRRCIGSPLLSSSQRRAGFTAAPRRAARPGHSRVPGTTARPDTILECWGRRGPRPHRR